MKDTLKPGATAQFAFRIPAEKTVPHLYPEAAEFREMPTVFATGFMVGLMEWTCLKVLEPHLEEGEGSLGVHIDVSHIAATVPGQTVTVDAECTGVDRSARLVPACRAHDGIDLIGEGRHERMISALDAVRRPRQRQRPSSPASCRSGELAITITLALTAHGAPNARNRYPPVQHQLRTAASGGARRACASCSSSTARWWSASTRTSASCTAAPRS